MRYIFLATILLSACGNAPEANNEADAATTKNVLEDMPAYEGCTIEYYAHAGYTCGEYQCSDGAVHEPVCVEFAKRE